MERMMRKLVMATLALLVGAAACTDSTSGGSGRTQVYITDDPFPYGDIARVDLYISKIEATISTDTTGLGGDWVTIAQPEKTFNLLDFQGGASVLAGEVDLPAGQYRAIRVTINTALSHIIRNGGAEATVFWPVNGVMSLYAYVENALEVPEGGAQIVIDFDVGRSFLVLESFAAPSPFAFSPVLRAVNATATGSIGGTITGPDIEGHATPVADAVVILMTAPGLGAMPAMIGTSRTDAQGHYVIAYVHQGDYNLGVWAPPYFAYNAGNVGTHVTTGARTTVDFSLTRGTGPDTTGSGPDTTGTTPGGPVASVALRIGTPTATTTIGTGDSIPLIAELRNAEGQIVLGRPVSWSVSDSTVISLEGTFGQYAHLRALKNGTATVTATSEGKSASLTFTVSGTGTGGGGGAVATVSVRIWHPFAVAAVGDSVTGYADLFNATGAALTGRVVAWSVSDSTVLSISGIFGQSLLMRAKKAGTATVSAVSEGKNASASVTVFAVH